MAGWGLGWLAGRLESLNPLLNGLQGAADNASLLSGSILERLKHPGTFLTMFMMVLLIADYFVQKIKESKTSTQADNPIVVSEPTFKIVTKGFVLMWFTGPACDRA